MVDEVERGDIATRFKVGNEAWKARSTHGRKPLFATPEILWDACCEYFQWVNDNPLQTVELVKFQGVGQQHQVPLMRNMSEDGLTIFLDIDYTTWHDYKSKPDFSQVTEKVVRVIRTYKLDGAVSGLFKENIIARELGLADKSGAEPVVKLEIAGDLLYRKDGGK